MLRLVTLALAFVGTAALAQDRFANVEIVPTHLNQSAHMLVGAGGNIGVSAGEDGIMIIDDQFEPLAEKIAAALKDINSSDVRYIVNTHYHGDHTGGNAWFKDNHDATIFAHDNVRIRLALNSQTKPSALPVVTYENGVKIHFNGDTLRVMHMGPGHTDGDSAVFFENANVLHAGDLFFNKMFPYIDLGSGGSVEGYIHSIQTLVDLVNDNTQIIPGHGELASKTDLQNYLRMLRTTAAIVSAKKYRGTELATIVEEGLGEEWQSWGWRFINEERWITTLYNGL